MKGERLLDAIDYLFYRIDNWFRYRDDFIEQGGISNFRALAFLTVLEGITLTNVYVLSELVVGFSLVTGYLKIAALVISIVLFAVNNGRYGSKARVAIIRSRWKNETSENKSSRGRLIVVCIVVTLLGPFILSSFR